MAKITPLTNITNIAGDPAQAATDINANQDAIVTAFDNTISRDGSTPNEMNVELDMGLNRVVNVGEAIAPQDLLTFGQFNEMLNNMADAGVVGGVGIDVTGNAIDLDLTAGQGINVEYNVPTAGEVTVSHNLSPGPGVNLLANTPTSGALQVSAYPYYAQTTAENAASAVPVNFSYPPGDVRRFNTGGFVLGYNTDYVTTVIGLGSFMTANYAGSLKNRLPGTRDLRTIVGGYDNEITPGTGGDTGGLACAIGGSHHSQIQGVATHASVWGGSLHTITDGDYSVIAGGTQSTISGGTGFSSIVGGSQHSITLAPGDGFASIFGGFDHTVTGRFSGVFGGNQNTTNGPYSGVLVGQLNVTSGSFSTAVGGFTNTVAGDYASALGGNTNTISGATNGGYSVTLGGLNNTIGVSAISRFSGILGGRSNTLNADYSATVGGRDCTVTGEASVAMGYGATAPTPGMLSRSGGYFTSPGDSQASQVVMRRQTTDATPTELRAGPALGNRLILSNDSTYGFSILLSARNTAAEEGAAYRVEGCMNLPAAGVVSFIGTPVKTVLGETVAAWDVNVVADNTNKALQILVTGEAGKTINWAADVQLIRISG